MGRWVIATWQRGQSEAELAMYEYRMRASSSGVY
jgi:hypothetical protein